MLEATRNRPAMGREAAPKMSVGDTTNGTGPQALQMPWDVPDAAPHKQFGDGEVSNLPRTTWTAVDLIAADFPPLTYAVDGLVPEGLSLLVGPPKVGKSWAALDLGVAVASGGPALGGVAVDQGDVFYLALEDGPRRLRDRLSLRLRDEPPPERLRFATHAPAINEGLTALLDDWHSQVLAPRLVIVDVLAKVKPVSDGRRSAYAEDYAALAPLQQWATEKRAAVVVVHHTRKAKDDDYLASVSGTHGLAGSADAVLVLTRPRTSGNAVLSVTGRDIAEQEVALSFDGDNGLWRVVGGSLDTAAQEVHTSRATAGVGDRMTDVITHVIQSTEFVKPADIAAAIGMSVDDAGRYLRRAADAGRIERTGRGTYAAPVVSMSEASEVSAAEIWTHDATDSRDTSDKPLGSRASCSGCGEHAERTSSAGTPWCAHCWDEASRLAS